MATFSRSHQFTSGAGAAFLPAGGHTVHGRRAVTFWSNDGAAYTLRLTRPDGTPIDAPIPATPNHYVTFDLHPDETLNVQANSAGGSTINVMVV